MTKLLLNILFWNFFTLAGWLLVIGTYKRWEWLIDPPTKYWMVYSQSAIKRVFGRRTVVIFTYSLAVALIVVGMFSLIQIGISATHVPGTRLG